MPFSPRGIEQSLVLPPRWPLILYTGTLYGSAYSVIFPLHELTESYRFIHQFHNTDHCHCMVEYCTAQKISQKYVYCVKWV